ncbi:hypothetical protein ACJX0J_035221 [Zea mays]
MFSQINESQYITNDPQMGQFSTAVSVVGTESFAFQVVLSFYLQKACPNETVNYLQPNVLYMRKQTLGICNHYKQNKKRLCKVQIYVGFASSRVHSYARIWWWGIHI